ncbi:hypothetical protein SH501x_001126 [Pirellulaceae bacterium SH501]
MKRRNTLMLLAVTLIPGIFAVTFYGWRTSARRNLPWSATDVREHYVDMFVDYAYYLRARIDEDDFPGYARRLGLAVDSNTMVSLDKANGDLPSWWTPSSERDKLYLRQDGDHFMAATYDGEYLFVQAWSH